MKRLARNARYLPTVALVMIMGLFLVACGSGGGGKSSTAPAPTPATVAPAITSANSAVFTEGAPGSFTVTTSGTPVPIITATSSTLYTFVDNGNGTGTLTPAPKASGVETITITASNGVGTPATQDFTLTMAVPGDNILPITNGITLATVNSHWVVVNQCEVTGYVTPIPGGLAFELTSGDSGFKAMFTDTLGATHTSIGTWAANGGSALLVTTATVYNPGSYPTSWTVSGLDTVTGSTSSSQFAAWVNWFGGNDPDLQTSPGLVPPTSVGCTFTLASGGI